MIECYVNEHGYYIHGDDIEIARKLTPSTIGDEPVLDQLQHMYAVMYSAMVDLKGTEHDRVFIYHYSRIIDDLNGHQTLGPWFEAVRTMIRQRLLPDIGGVIFFRKKSAREIDDRVQFGIDTLGVDDAETDKMLRNRIEEKLKQHEAAIKTRAADLRRRWFNAET